MILWELSGFRFHSRALSANVFYCRKWQPGGVMHLMDLLSLGMAPGSVMACAFILGHPRLADKKLHGPPLFQPFYHPTNAPGSE